MAALDYTDHSPHNRTHEALNERDVANVVAICHRLVEWSPFDLAYFICIIFVVM